MSERKSLIEIALMPVVVALIGIVGVIMVQQERNAQALRKAQLESSAAAAAADREVRMLEIFAGMITSPDESQRVLGLQMLRALEVDVAERLAGAITQGGAITEGVAESSELPTVPDPVAEDVATVDMGAPRIYMHIQQEADRLPARAIASHLAAKGFAVAEIEHMVDGGPRLSQLRFFREAEQEEASEISKILEGLGVGVELTYIAGYEESRSNRPRRYEIWFAAGTLSAG